MASNLQHTLHDPKYRNWVKAGLVLKCTKDGIQRFVDAEIHTFQQRMLTDIIQIKGLASGTICNSCTTQNVLPCRTAGTCSSRGRCNYHDNTDMSKMYRPCSTGICNEIYDRIIKAHRFNGPSWRNSDAQIWCSNSWEVAKCYMAAGGYSNAASAADTDFPGLISVVINHCDFQNVIAENLTNPKNLFYQARTIRNEILHSSTFQLSDVLLNNYIDTMIRLLSDPKYLATDTDAKEAITKLTQIKNGCLVVTNMDEMRIRNEVLMAIREEKQLSLDSLRTEGSEQIRILEQKTDDTLHNIQTKGAAQANRLDKMKEETVQTIQKESDEQGRKLNEKKDGIIQNIHAKALEEIEMIDRKGLNVMSDVQRKGTDQIQDIEAKKQAAVEAIKEQIERSEKESKSQIRHIHKATDAILNLAAKPEYMVDEKKKKDLQMDLINMYMENYLKTSVTPLAPDDDEELEHLYVKPNMKQVNPHENWRGYNEINGIPIESYKDIFHKNSRQCKKIYVVGDAGTGKTSLCQRLISTWCRVHMNDTKSRLSEDEKVMLNFQFLFYISLRHAVSDSDIDKMIINQLLQNSEHEALLLNILKKDPNQCLVILDGLDEWSPPAIYSQRSPVVNKGLPCRNVMNTYTVITTSRPWKLEILRLNTSEIDQQIVLKGIDSNSSEQFVKCIVTVLNKKHGRKMDPWKFELALMDRNLQQFSTIPVILKQLVCLWHEGKPLGESKCGIYSGMINLLFELTEQRMTNDNELSMMNEKMPKYSNVLLPKCFAGKVKCQEFRDLIYSLGRLSFETLFSQDMDSSLVFESTTAEMHGLSKHAIDLCLKVGILSQSKIAKGCTARMKLLSFLHKTFQEFLASVYVAMNDPSEEIVQVICDMCSSISNIFEMENAFIFISGMNSRIAYRLSEHICDITRSVNVRYRRAHNARNFIHTPNHNRITKILGRRIFICSPIEFLYNDHLQDHKDVSDKVKRIDSLMVDCVTEGVCNGNESIKMKREDIFIGYCSETMHQLENLGLTVDNIKSIYVDDLDEEVSLELSAILTEVTSLQKLVIRNSTNPVSVSEDDICNMLCKSNSTLQTLDLSHHACDMSELTHGQFSSMLPDFDNIRVLKLSNMQLTSTQYVFLLAYISQAVKMQDLHLEHLACLDSNKEYSTNETDVVDHQTEAFSYQLDLSNHQRLFHLYLILPGVHVVYGNSNQLLSCVSYAWFELVFLFKFLKHATKLQMLHIHGNVDPLGINSSGGYNDAADTIIYGKFNKEKDVNILVECLQIPLAQMKRVKIENINFGNSKIMLSPEMKLLEYVHLKDVSMTSQYFNYFLDSIADIKELHMIDLDITDPNKETWVELSPRMKNLKYIRLMSGSIPSRGLCNFVDSIPHTKHDVIVEFWRLQFTPLQMTDMTLKYIRSRPWLKIVKDDFCTIKGPRSYCIQFIAHR